MKVSLIILVTLFFAILDTYFFINKLIETKKIKISSNDKDIKAKVVGGHLFITGDIRPILLYKINEEEKEYTCRFYYSAKKYPIGKEVDLKISMISGLAYIKNDLIKDFIFHSFRMIYWFFGLLISFYYLYTHWIFVLIN